MDKDKCPTSKSGNHYFTVYQVKYDFEPQSYGDTAADTLYKRIEYEYAACACSYMVKRKVQLSDD